MKNDSIMFFFMLLLNITFAYGQETNFPEPDSSGNSDSVEQLVEQGGEGEDSPVVDLLTDEKGPALTRLHVRSRIIHRLQQPAGYSDGTYLGSPVKSYHRLKFSAGTHFSGGVLIEKDPGERKINDFMSGNLMMHKTGLFPKVILGDYLVESGQGVALWRGFDAAKGSDIIAPVVRKSRGAVPYLSSDENTFFRGIALQSNIQKFTIDLFYSSRNRAATLDDDGIVSSFYTAGYFRTENEKAKKSTVAEMLIGAFVRYHVSLNQEVGLTLYKTSFSKPLISDDEEQVLRSRFSMASFNYRFEVPPAVLFGEWARSQREVGGISGMVFQPVSSVKIITAFRRYPSGFISLHGLGFRERLGANNEHGIYFGISLKPVKYITLIGYADQFSFPEQAGFSQFPSYGSERFLQATISSFKRLSLSLRYVQKRNQNEEVVQNAHGFMIKESISEFRHTIRLNLDYDINKEIRVRARFERVHVTSESSTEDEKGLLMFHDLAFKPDDNILWNFRMIYFQTDSFTSRVYEYENDLEGVLSLPLLYGRGFRWYLLMKYDVSTFLKVSLKYSDILRDDIKRIGSGVERLPSNHDNRIGIQLDMVL